MPTPPVPSKGFLTRKLGPAPVWGWGAGGLVIAYGISRYRANKTAKSATGATSSPSQAAGAAQPAAGAPYYVIENNLPPTPGAAPSTPIPPPVGQPPTAGPPSTTPSPPTNQPPPAPTPTPAPAGTAQTGASTYRVQAGDTLSSIASSHNIPGGWTALWAYQLDPANNPPAQIATLRQRGPNLLYPGQTIRIPAHY